MYIRMMVHHWRASDHLEHSFRSGEWRMYDRGRLVGVIQLGRINGKSGLRGTTRDGEVLGYAWTLEEASDRLWEWYQRSLAAKIGDEHLSTTTDPGSVVST
jgi:hypothetical protein